MKYMLCLMADKERGRNMLMRHKYRARPTQGCRTNFAQTFSCTRNIYNKYVEINKTQSSQTSKGNIHVRHTR